MKNNIQRYITLLLLIFSFCSCQAQNKGTSNIKTLSNAEGWKIDTIAPGYVWYNYTNYYAPTNSNQTINVLEVDYKNPKYTIEVVHSEDADSLSSFAIKNNAIAGINGSYFEPSVSFVKVDNHIYREVTIQPDSVSFWKHKGALFYNADTKELSIEVGDNDKYKASSFPTILSGAPMLIENFNPVGETFADKPDSIDIKTLDYEDYRRHQGVRHPRVAIALTENQRLLMVVVDGRWWTSSGMTAKELTLFLKRHFNPQYALNIDGGGSTTMWIKNRGVVGTNVVNYPSDNKRYDHYGQRSVNNVILIKEKQ